MNKDLQKLVVDIVDVYYRAKDMAGQVDDDDLEQEVDGLLWDIVNQMEEGVEGLEGIMMSGKTKWEV